MRPALPLIIATLVSTGLNAQWVPIGAPIAGATNGDGLGRFNAIEVDEAGNTIAVGSVGTPSTIGYAKVLDWNGSQWVQRGSSILGIVPGDGTGSAVELSADGNTLAVSTPWGANALGYPSGHVHVYEWDGTAWMQRGSRIDGEGNSNPFFDGDVFGMDMDLSPDGQFLAVGAPSNTQQVGVLQFQGQARVYQWDGTDWAQMGQDIDGEISLEDFGNSLSISDDGSKLAVGGRGYRIWQGDTIVIAEDAGIVRTYEWDGAQWSLRTAPMIGVEYDRLGHSVSLSSDGNSMAVGAPSSTSTGLTRIFDWNGTTWQQRGGDIIGALNARSGTSVDLSANGNLVAIGEPWMNFANGGAKVFGWNGSAWAQVHSTMQGIGPSTAINAFGSSVVMNASATVVAVGAPFHDAGGSSDAGLVYVFENAMFTGVEEGTRTTLRCYPNPASDVLNIEADGPIRAIELFDILGQQVQRTEVGFSNMKLDVRDLPAGTYQLRIFTPDATQVVRFVRQ